MNEHHAWAYLLQFISSPENDAGEKLRERRIKITSGLFTPKNRREPEYRAHTHTKHQECPVSH